MKTTKNVILLKQIEQAIFIIRGQKVMLDRDLSQLYGVQTKALKQAVNRNIHRFPSDFMFVLTADEHKNLRSQIVTSSLTGWGGTRYSPMAFTEQGVAMLSSVLGSERAIEVNIAIMRAFVRLREMMNTSRELAKKLHELETHIVKHDESIGVLFKAIRALMAEPDKPKKQIGFTAKETRAAYAAK